MAMGATVHAHPNTSTHTHTLIHIICECFLSPALCVPKTLMFCRLCKFHANTFSAKDQDKLKWVAEWVQHKPLHRNRHRQIHTHIPHRDALHILSQLPFIINFTVKCISRKLNLRKFENFERPLPWPGLTHTHLATRVKALQDPRINRDADRVFEGEGTSMCMCV